MQFSTFLFDLDGTLVDHLAAIHRAHSHTMQKLGLPPPSLTQVRNAIGGGVEVAIARLIGQERVAQALPIYRPYWESTMLQDVKLLPGTRDLLEALHAAGATLAVFTNKHGPSSRLVCDHLDLSPLLSGNFGATDTPWLKPQPEFAAHALKKLGKTAQGTLLIGDSPWDVEAAKTGGFASWCVTTGTHNADELAASGADKVFPDLYAVAKELGLSIRRRKAS
jgi:phosphoglycolate phosphatase